MPYYEKTAKGTRAHVFVKGVRDSDTLPNFKAAQLWAARRTIELNTIASGQEGKLRTVQDAFQKYAEEVAPGHKGARWEIVRLEKLKRDFGPITMDKLADTHLLAWRDMRLRQVSAGSVLREMKLLNSVFEHARKEWKWLSVNPCKDVRRPPSPPSLSRVIGRWEILGVLRALGYPARSLPRHAVAYAFLLALRTGMRQSELAGIQWTDVFPRFIRLHDTKNGTLRDVPLSRKAVAVVDRMRGYHPESVFNLTAGAIDVQFRGAKSRAGLSGFTFHASRHTAATWIGRSGKLQLLELCRAFGWNDPKVALIYFNPTASDIAARL